MRVAIVDDEESCLQELAGLLERYGAEHGIQLETEAFDSGEAFVASLEAGRYAMAFLDIFMEGMDGLAAAARLWEQDKKCLLVFLTSSGDFRPEALSVHAFEYLVKPISPERMAAVLEDALAVLPPIGKYIEVASGRRLVPLFLADILSAVTDAHYLDIHLSSGASVRSRMTIQEFLGKVGPDPRFITVNKGIVLNADYVQRFESGSCILENGEAFPVRVRDRAQVEQSVRDYHFTKIRSRQRHGR